ncbi:roadblock/LC7 domain-containing protein [Patescibacteria group bacterium]|nr:roadblock/LC7 domain-containing protein [Patescibacteria group bacterium]MBU4579992.1 roadblock/LC7 domain-containing protein [Patescibacteria group bacterium]
MTRKGNSELEKILRSFMNIEAVLAAVVVNSEGVLLESNVSKGVNTKVLISNYDLLSIAKEKGEKLKKGNLNEIILSFENAKLIIKKVNADAVLLALIGKEANLQLIELEIKRAAREIKKVV